MALVYADSFDHYATANAAAKGWDTGSGTIGATGRFGTNGLLTTTNLRRTLPANYTTFVCGAAVQVPQTGDGLLFTLIDAAAAQVEVRLNAAGKLYVTRSGTALGSPGTAVLTINQFYFIEFKFTIDNSAGVAIVRVNGVVDINLSSQDTQSTANAYINQFRIDSHVNSVTVDDLYILDTTGGAPTNDFLGDVRVEATFPSGNGNSSQLVGQDADSTDNYLNVDETTPDGDTTYNESSTVNDKDTYAFGDLTSTTGTVYGVQICPYARKTDAGVRSIKSVARLSGTETDSADKTLNSTYAYLTDIRETKPGGGAWSITDVNNAEFGVKVSA